MLRYLRSVAPESKFKSKDLVEFECIICGAGSQGEWRMQFNNVIYGHGCQICRSIWPLIKNIHESFPELVVVPHVQKRGFSTPIDTIYEIRPRESALPEVFGWEAPYLMHASVKTLFNKRLRPGEAALKQHDHYVEVLITFREAFPMGSIQYVGNIKAETTTPGPYYELRTGTRELRTPIQAESITEKKLLMYCQQEQEDRQLRSKLEDDANRHGAIVHGYVHDIGGRVRIRYRSRTYFERCDTPERAAETLWGQTRFRKGEALALLTLMELFPSDDWIQNSRPDFLMWKNNKSLQLDGYSANLNLALEYHGPQHYGPIGNLPRDVKTFEQQVERDNAKIEMCQGNIHLVVVPHISLDAQLFLHHIQSIIHDMGLSPINNMPSWQSVDEKWRGACNNPLAAFQTNVQTALRSHVLLSPELELVTFDTKLTYRCSNCGAINQAIAKGMLSGLPRSYCPSCKGRETAAKRRKATLEKWLEAGLTEGFLNKLDHRDGDYWFTCEREHRSKIHNAEFAKRNMGENTLNCPSCVEEDFGISAIHASDLLRYQESMAEQVRSLGLTVLNFLSYHDKEAVANVVCPNGHQFTVDHPTVSLMRKNKCFGDRAIVPTACPTCCFPDVDTTQFFLLRSTVFHRLDILRGLYINARYISGFDPTGWSVEKYSCGEHFSDGLAHPPIRIAFRNLARAAVKDPTRHLCLICGLKSSQVLNRGKSTDDLVGLMKLMREEIAKIGVLPKKMAEPTVEIVSGELSALGEISTTKTMLKFWCGVPTHTPRIATKDNYFNRADAKGRGFCAECVELAGIRKAPLPLSRVGLEQLALRRAKLRMGSS